MDSSLTLSAETSILSMLCAFSQNWELSASSVEKSTKTAELISTLLLLGRKSSDHAVLISLMLEDATQMLYHLVAHRRKVTTMLQRMVTLSEGGLSDQMEAKFLALAMHGLRSSTRRVEMSFGDLFRNWLLEVLPAISTPCETTPIGSIEKTPHHTSTQPISALTRETFLNSMNGYNTTWKDIHAEVGDACGWPSTVSAWPAGTAPTGHPIGDPTLMGQCPSMNIH
ncbi:Rep [uncultured virus]|uniref:Rep n=1 Tax=uncultured virus TaxID=340016 RepID=A0A2K9LT66_9VIRU|nr:Rep [uncultured virus]